MTEEGYSNQQSAISYQLFSKLVFSRVRQIENFLTALAVAIILENLGKQKWLGWGTWLLSLMGIYSYEIYLIHQPLYSVLFLNLISCLQVNSYLKIIFVMIITALALICYVLLFTWIDQYIGKIINKIWTKQN